MLPDQMGVVVGVLGAFLLARTLGNVLYGVGPTDPTVLLGASGVVFVVALAACGRPAWQAMRVAPKRVLKAD